jgi:hypothetical protein
MSHVKSNHWGAKIPRKKLTMEKLKYFKKRCFLEGKDGIHHGGKSEKGAAVCFRAAVCFLTVGA